MAFAIDDLDSVGAHWRADALGYADGNDVSAWADSSVNAVDLTATVYPTFHTNQLNGLPAVRFNGTDHRMVSSVDLPCAGWAAPTVIAVIKTTSTATYNGVLTLDTVSPATNPNVYSVWFGSTRILYLRGTANYTSPGSTASGWCLVSMTHGLYARGGAKDGLLSPQTSSVGTGDKITANLKPTMGYWPFSGNQYGGFDLAEMVLLNETTLSERLHVEGSLADKYAITLAVDHPFFSGPPTTQPGAAGASQSFHPLGGA